MCTRVNIYHSALVGMRGAPSDFSSHSPCLNQAHLAVCHWVHQASASGGHWVRQVSASGGHWVRQASASGTLMIYLDSVFQSQNPTLGLQTLYSLSHFLSPKLFSKLRYSPNSCDGLLILSVSCPHHRG